MWLSLLFYVMSSLFNVVVSPVQCGCLYCSVWLSLLFNVMISLFNVVVSFDVMIFPCSMWLSPFQCNELFNVVVSPVQYGCCSFLCNGCLSCSIWLFLPHFYAMLSLLNVVASTVQCGCLTFSVKCSLFFNLVVAPVQCGCFFFSM